MSILFANAFIRNKPARKYNGSEQESFHLAETGIVPGKRSLRLFSCPHRPTTRAKAKQEDEILQSWSFTQLCESILVLLTVTLSRFQSISYPRHSFLMTFRTLEGITKEYVTLKFY